MKKSLLLLSLLLLVGCQAKDTSKTETANSTSSQSSTSSSSSEETPAEVDYSSYQQVIARYLASIGKDGTAINQEEVNVFLTFLQTYPGTYRGPYYVQEDFDQDGIEELAIAFGYNAGYILIDLYTLSPEGDLLRLSDQFRQQGPGIGEKVTLWPLVDGTYSLESAGQSRLYRYDSTGKQLVLQEDGASPATAVDLTGLDWKELKSSETTSQSSSSETLDVEAILAGDYSSLAGTWTNAKGHIMEIDSAGNVVYPQYSDEKNYFEKVSLREDGVLGTGITSPTRQVSPTIPHLIVPVGVEIPVLFRHNEPDLTDNSRVRIYGFNGSNTIETIAQEAYYRQN